MRASQKRGLLYALILLLIAVAGMATWRQERQASEGFPGFPPDVPLAAVNPFGVNVELSQYDEAELERALDLIEAGGFRWVRQTFPWAEIEPQRGRYEWAIWDRIVAAVRERGLELIAVLDTSPAWARRGPNPHTPPQDVADFGHFARAFAARYGDDIDYYQIWDEPNLSPHWGDAYVDPAAYARLLREGYVQIKSADPTAFVLTAGLAPNVEGGPLNLNEIAFLEGLYAAGGGDFFDILALKPYGFDAGPDDRRVGVGVLNFSRAELGRDFLVAHGDGEKAIWAVEFGWNSLPPDWRGRPSIWGQVSAEEQASYAVRAYLRALNEWPWLGVLAWAEFQPAVPPDDPHWGFALVDVNWRPRPVYERLRELATREPVAYPGRYPANHYAARYRGHWRLSPFGADIGRSGDSLVIPFKGTRLDLTVRRGQFWAALYVTVDGRPANALPRDSQGRSYLVLYDPLCRPATVTLARGLADEVHKAKLVAQGGWGQWAIVGWTVSREPNLRPYRLALALLGACALGLILAGRRDVASLGPCLLPAARRLLSKLADRYRGLHEGLQAALLALAAALFYFPPWPPLSLSGLALLAVFIYLRLDLGLALATLSIPFFLRPKPLLGLALPMVEVATLLCFAAWILKAKRWKLKTSFQLSASSIRHRLSSLDFAVTFFVAVAAASLLWAENREVATREFRAVVLEPALFYLLVRSTLAREEHRRLAWRLADALVLAAVAASLIGLYQYTMGDVVVVEGVRRVRGVYGSPNNLGLFLGRVVPILAAVVLFGRSLRRRAAYLAVGLPIVACLYLTYSRGAWLLGLPAALLFLGLVRGRRALLISLVALLAIALSLVPLIGTERLALDLQGGTAFFRLKLWQSALNMIRDHPLTGVGLDNFLYHYRTRYVLPEAWEELNLSHPHNILLDWWTRLGVLGVVALVWLEVAFFKRSWALYRRLDDPDQRALVLGLMASMVDFLGHGLIDNSYFLVDLAFVFCLTLGVIEGLSEE